MQLRYLEEAAVERAGPSTNSMRELSVIYPPSELFHMSEARRRKLTVAATHWCLEHWVGRDGTGRERGHPRARFQTTKLVFAKETMRERCGQGWKWRARRDRSSKPMNVR